MSFDFHFADEAKEQPADLAGNPAHAKRYKAVRAALGKLQINTRHPGLRTHKFDELTGANGEAVFVATLKTTPPGAYHILWFYGPSKDVITIVAVTPHP